MTGFEKNIQNSTSDSYHAKGQVGWYQNDYHVRVGRWQENLTKREQEIVSYILDPTLKKLGYLCN